jgi:hypothetical protein
MASMKRAGKPVETIVVRRTQTLAKPLDQDDGLRILGQLVGHTLIAASHRQGFLAGLQQLADDRKELQEFREFKAAKKKRNIP